jgi:hypothetical protein
MGTALETLDEARAEVATLQARLAVDDDAMKHLAELYALIWIEANYDPFNEGTERFAKKLEPHIRALNDKYRFKR